jgi:hypothetical protein
VYTIVWIQSPQTKLILARTIVNQYRELGKLSKYFINSKWRQIKEKTIPDAERRHRLNY